MLRPPNGSGPTSPSSLGALSRVKPRAGSSRRYRAPAIGPERAAPPRVTWQSIHADRTRGWRGSCWNADGGPPRWLKLACAVALTCATWLAPLRAEAHTPADPLVVVLSSNPEAPFVRRLSAELALFGYRVEVVTRGGAEVRLDELLRTTAAEALIAVDAGNRSAEVIVARGASVAPQRVRERLDPRRRADTNAAVLAERFRARLTELGIAPSASALPLDLPDAPRAASSPALADRERLLWVAALVGGTSGGLGFMPDAQLEIRAFPVRWLSTGAFAKVSPFPAQLRAPEGEADVRWLAGGVLIDVYPWRDPIVIKAGVGAMLVSAAMSGRAQPPWGGRKDAVLVPAGLFHAGVALRMGSRAFVELESFLGACSPRVGVRFGGRTVGDFGQPFFGASLGLAVGIF